MQSSASNRFRSSSAETAVRAGVTPAAVHALDLEGQIGRLVKGSLDVERFRQWFANALWDIELAADGDMVRFAYLVENRLAEFTGGYISEQELVAALHEDLSADARVVATTMEDDRRG